MSNKAKDNLSERLLKKILIANSLISIGFSVLEMNVRQYMPQALQSALGPDWLTDELTNPRIPLFIEEVALIRRRKSQHFVLTGKKFLEEASLGFWVELFNRETYKYLKGAPIKAFEWRPTTVKRSDIYVLFKEVKDLRNNIVHNRLPFGQERETDLRLLKKLQQAEQNIRLLIGYINPSALRLLPKNFEKKIQEIEKMIGN
jgi:hypothetical protein